MVAKLCFYTSNEDSVILRIKRRWMHSTGFVCYIPSLLAFTVFIFFFLWRSNSGKKVYLYDKDILLMLFFLAVFFINLWLGGFFCCISFLQFLLISLFWFWRLSSLLLLSLGFVVLGLFHLTFLGYLTPSCVRFLNYFKEGKKHFYSLNVFFSWVVPECR